MHTNAPEPSTTLRATHTSSVTEDQIDHLGHMNVRFYAVNALAGTQRLLADLPGWDDKPHLVHDTYTRHHREQLLGTPLIVRSAVLGASPAGLRLHHELAAADSGVLAATFVHRISPVDEKGQRLPVPAEVIAGAEGQAIELPAYAATRTISLDSDLIASAPSLDVLVDRGLASRRERAVSADECDDRGAYRAELTPLLTWGGAPIEDGIEAGDDLHETRDGKLMGWASMETRVQLARLPSVGSRIQAFTAVVGIHDKVVHQLNWCVDLDLGELLTAFETVSLAFDTRARRPMQIPDGYRHRHHDRLHPDLAP